MDCSMSLGKMDCKIKKYIYCKKNNFPTGRVYSNWVTRVNANKKFFNRSLSIKQNGKERKTLFGLDDNRVLSKWIYERREKHLRLSCALDKTKVIYDKLTDSEKSESFLPAVGG